MFKRWIVTKADRKRLFLAGKLKNAKSTKPAMAKPLNGRSPASPHHSKTGSEIKTIPKPGKLEINHPIKAIISDNALEQTQVWYSDPYILAKKLVKLSAQEAIDIVKRHTGAGNQHVYAALLKHLVRLREFKLAVQCFQSFTGELTPAGYTLVLVSLANVAKEYSVKDADSRRSQLRTGIRVWETVKKLEAALTRPKLPEQLESAARKHNPRNPIEAYKFQTVVCDNAMLQLCMETAEYGGWEFGCKLFGNMDPDIRSYTIMYRLCASYHQGWEHGLGIWNDMKMDADERCLAAFLLLVSRNIMQNSKNSGLDAVKLLGLPVSHKDTEPTIVLQITTPILTTLILIANKLKYPSLGQRWATIAKARGVVIDEGVNRSLASMFLESKNYHQAWETCALISQSLDIALRICSEAVAEDPEEWSNKAHYIYSQSNQKLEARDLVNYLITQDTAVKPDLCIEAIVKHQRNLINVTTEKMEDALQSQSREKANQLRLRIKGLWLISSILKSTGAQEQLVVKRRMKLAMDTLDSLHLLLRNPPKQK